MISSSRSVLRHWLPALLLFVTAGASTPAADPPATSFLPMAFTESATTRAAKLRSLAAEIDALYRDHAVAQHIPGLAYGVVLDGDLVVAGSHGFADVARQIPATPRTVFRVASMTKSFTAMSLLRLRDQGRVELDRPASRYLPELRRLPLLTTDSPPITLRHLLTHGAGFPEDNPWGDRQLADTDDDLVNLVRSPARFSNPPGFAFEYSNLGFALAGRAVARVSGRSCQSYITRNILEPLGMMSTYWEPRRVPADRLAHGYRWLNETWVEEPQLADGSYAPMGGMLSTVEDFARYIALHLSAWPPRDDPENPILRRSSLREMHQPWRFTALSPNATNSQGQTCAVTSAYSFGLGWARDCQDRVRVGHSGGLPGFGSQWRILPDYGLGVVVFGNLTYAGFSTLNTRVIDRILERTALAPRALPASEILRSRAAALVRLLPDWEGAEASGLFAENFFPDNPPEGLRRRTRELFGKLGELQSVEPVQAQNQLRGTVQLVGSRGRLELFLTLTPENPPRIQEVQIGEPAVH